MRFRGCGTPWRHLIGSQVTSATLVVFRTLSPPPSSTIITEIPQVSSSPGVWHPLETSDWFSGDLCDTCCFSDSFAAAILHHHHRNTPSISYARANLLLYSSDFLRQSESSSLLQQFPNARANLLFFSFRTSEISFFLHCSWWSG